MSRDEIMHATGMDVVSIDRVEGDGDDHYRRQECLTCRSSVRLSGAWQVTYRIGAGSAEHFRAIVCDRCARRIRIAQKEA